MVLDIDSAHSLGSSASANTGIFGNEFESGIPAVEKVHDICNDGSSLPFCCKSASFVLGKIFKDSLGREHDNGLDENRMQSVASSTHVPVAGGKGLAPHS